MKLLVSLGLMLFLCGVLSAQSANDRNFIVEAQTGDTVATLANRYGADPVEIAKYNGLLPTTVLGAGRKLAIPKRSAVSGAACKLSVGTSPSVRGVKLGMTAEEFAKLLHPQPDGLARHVGNGRFYPSEFKDSARMEGIERLEAEFFDDHLSVLTVKYDGSVEWKNDGEFREAVARGLGLPDLGWKISEAGMSMPCEGFTLYAEENSITLTDDRAAEARMNQESDAKTKKKAAFKP